MWNKNKKEAELLTKLKAKKINTDDALTMINEKIFNEALNEKYEFIKKIREEIRKNYSNLNIVDFVYVLSSVIIDVIGDNYFNENDSKEVTKTLKKAKEKSLIDYRKSSTMLDKRKDLLNRASDLICYSTMMFTSNIMGELLEKQENNKN